MMYVANIAE